MGSRKNRNSIGAFTLLELLVGMVISGIVLGIIFTAGSIVTGRFRDFERSTSQARSLSFFMSTIQNDMDKVQGVRKSEQGLVLQQNSAQIHYRFLKDYVIRQSDHVDTFYVQAGALKTKTADIESDGSPDALLRIAEFEIKSGDVIVPVFLFKKYDSKTILLCSARYKTFMENEH